MLTFRALALRQSDFLIYAELYILQLSPLLPQRMFKRTRNEGKVSLQIYPFMIWIFRIRNLKMLRLCFFSFASWLVQKPHASFMIIKERSLALHVERSLIWLVLYNFKIFFWLAVVISLVFVFDSLSSVGIITELKGLRYKKFPFISWDERFDVI